MNESCIFKLQTRADPGSQPGIGLSAAVGKLIRSCGISRLGFRQLSPTFPRVSSCFISSSHMRGIDDPNRSKQTLYVNVFCLLLEPQILFLEREFFMFRFYVQTISEN